MAEDVSTCPKCGQPRPRAAVECPFCGVIFARFHGRSEPAAQPPEAVGSDAEPLELDAEPPADMPVAPHYASPGGLDEVYQGPSIEDLIAARAQTAAPGAAHRPGVASSSKAPWAGPVLRSAERPEARVESETVFTRNLGPSILIAAIFLLLVQAFVQSQVMGTGGDRDEANQILYSLAGIDAPEELGNARVLNWVGHRFVAFGDSTPAPGPIPTLLLLYRRGALAGGASAEDLAVMPRAKLDLLGIPFHHLANRSLTLNRLPQVAEWLSLGDANRPAGHFVSVAFEASDGEPALLVFAGSGERVQQMLRSFQ